MASKLLSRGLPVVLLIAAGVGGYAWWQGRLPGSGTFRSPASAPPPVIQAVGGLPNFSAIVQTFGPAVVNIATRSDGGGGGGGGGAFGLQPGDPLYDFFRHFGVPTPRGEGMRRSEGSGFVISADGVILTNAHVVAGASEVMVKLTDRREFRAKVVGSDRPADVAVLKIEAEGLPVVRIGDPAAVHVGEWVLAIGSPFGFENSATAGIVSAKARALPDENYVPFIQTDVAVNPGNSGGPLFNMKGEVIGINSQIYSRSGGYQGLSFAIPIDVAMKVRAQILEHGQVRRGRIGAAIQDLNQELALSFGLQTPKGALVSSVEPGSPADRAGLRAGDVVLAINGQPVEAAADLPPKVADIKPGGKAVLEIWRDRSSRKLEVEVGELAGPKAETKTRSEQHGRLGLSLRPLSGDEQQRFGLSGGLWVSDAGGAAAKAGIRAGDVILSANGTPVTSVEMLRQIVEKAGRHVALLIQRDGARMFVGVPLE